MYYLKMFIIKSSLLLLVLGCNGNQIIHFYSMDKSQSITVITRGNVRFVINGKHYIVPDSNYIKLDITNVSDLGDGVYICWKNDRFIWDVVVPRSKIIKAKLDTARYNFNTSLPLEGEYKIPRVDKFRKEGCAGFDYHSMRLIPNRGAIIKRTYFFLWGIAFFFLSSIALIIKRIIFGTKNAWKDKNKYEVFVQCLCILFLISGVIMLFFHWY